MIMEGMTIEQYAEVVAFSQKHHSFANWLSEEDAAARVKEFPSMKEFGDHGLNIKYIDCTYDSRDAQVWLVKFRQGRYGWCFSSNHFATIGGSKVPKKWKYDKLYDLCMAFLQGRFEPKEEFDIDTENP